MAKKVVIKGENILSSIKDPWSGINDTAETIEVYGTSVPPKAEWGVNLKEVARIIKATFGEKVAYQTEVEVVTPSGNVNRVISFASDDDYTEWDKLSDADKWEEEGKKYLINWYNLPSADVTDTYYVDVQIGSYSDKQPDTNVTLNIKGKSYIKHPGGTEERIVENLTILVQTRTSNTANWQSRDSFNITSEQEDWTPVDFSKYLTPGMNYIRLKAVGEFAEGLVWRNATIQVVGLSLVPNTSTNIPKSGETLSLNYLIGGNISKYLRLQFGTGIGDNFEPEWTYENSSKCLILVNGTNTSTGMTFDFRPSSSDLRGIMDNGLHTVRAQLYVSEELKTDWVETQYMVAQSADAPAMVVVNNVSQVVDNFTDVKFFDWASNKDTNVVFTLTDENNRIVYGRWEQAATANILYNLQTQLNIEYVGAELYGIMHITDGEGNELHPDVFFTVNNNSDYAPVTDPTFIFRPSTRSNDEENPRTIINEATGQVVPSTGWDSLGMTRADGYTNGTFVVPSGSAINVGFNPLKTMANTSGSATGLVDKNVAIEIDFKASNITDKTEPLIRLGSYITHQGVSDIWGLEVRPTEAALLTYDKRTRDDQNTSWSEDKRIRLTINIVYGLNTDRNGNKLNYIRLFVNDTIEKEVEYLPNDRFIISEDTQLILGGEGADLIIYGIRCYEKALSTDEVMKDYRAGLSTTVEKQEWMEKNNILGDFNTIDWVSAINAGYNVIGHTGHLPKYGDTNKGKTSGITLDIHIEGDPEHSGILSNLEGSGQGTTAMTYYDWNQQYKITDGTVFTPEEGTPTEPGTGYAIQEGEALAKKLVGKINFASSMQGHKMGITRLFDEVFKQLIRNGNMSKPGQMDENLSQRIAVYEKPFLFFHRETANDPWTFRYLMTFGAGKGDKPTFGFNKKTTPHMLMVEGADNDRTLALFMAPWNSEVNYNASQEAWYIGNQKHINFGFGLTDDNDAPSDAQAKNAIRDFFNFVYFHTRNISYYTGTLEDLQNNSPYAEGSNEPTIGKLYWMTRTGEAEFNRYDLFRFDQLTQTWVKAGMEVTDTINVRTQYEEFCTALGITADTWTAGQWASINTKIQNIRTRHFKEWASNYIHVDDALYHDCIIKLVAGTDNRSKNTYYYTDPVTLKIRWQQDDLDTTIKTNNVGQQRKPYYVEEHDKNSAGEYYWQGESSSFYNLLEEAFADELKDMMRKIFSAMATLAGAGKGTFDYLIGTILEAQNYFPAVAYNEMTRLVYETASIAQHNGDYINTIPAISQSNGTQKWSEYQWLTDRLMYISSWCEYGEFAAQNDTPGALLIRGTTGQYKFVLTPAKWLYPRIGQGGSNVAPSRSSNHVRVPAGQSLAYYDADGFRNEGDSSISLRGINYYSEIGDMNIPLSAASQTTFPFFGNKLKKITVNPNGTDANLFATQAITVTSINITEFIVRNVATLNNPIDLSQCMRLKKVDLRGSTPTRVILPETASLVEVHLPETVQEVVINNCPNLTTLTVENPVNVKKIAIEGCPKINAWDIVDQIYNLHLTQEVSLEELHFHGIHIDDDENLDELMWITELPTDDLTGYITLDNSINLTWLQKEKLINKFGNVDNPDNPLHITYYYEVDDSLPVYIFCNGIADTVPAIGNYQFRCIPMVSGEFDNTANYISKVEWAIENNPYATIDSSGILHVASLGTEVAKPTATITMTVTLIDGTIRTNTLVLGMYHKEIALGDLVYCDGSYSANVVYPQKTLVGVLYIDEDGIREIIKPKRINLTYYQWGLYSETAGGISGVTIDGSTPAYNVLKIKDISGDIQTRDTNSNFFRKDTDEFAPLTDLTNFKYIPEETESINISDDETVVFETRKHYSLGYYNTLAIIEWRNKVLNYAGLPLPEKDDEYNSLTSLIRQIILNNDNQAKYQGYYYPSASYCFAYEPVIKEYEVLDNRFKKHNWFLPCAGELARIDFYSHRNDETGESKYDAFKGKASIFNIGNVTTSSESSGNTTAYIYDNLLKARASTSSATSKTNSFGYQNFYHILPACSF